MRLIQAIRGMNDILPPETALWQFVEDTIRSVLTSYCYEEIRFPILEKTELFKRSIGDTTDIVEKEMYTFTDRNNESLSLRPEGTAPCVRAGLEHGIIYNQIKRLWYMGPYFRHERPQKGRYRQFHQCGVEIFGIATPDIDVELLLLSATIFSRLQLTPYVKLQLNTLGSTLTRQQYRELLVQYFTQHKQHLDEDSLRRLMHNPLRILDSKNPDLQSIIQNAPKLIDHLDDESKNHFAVLKQHLDQLGMAYEINPCLVRGLDYYTKTVFEWVTEELGAQNAVCSGGRYDGLIEQLGGKNTPALGFAIGLERLILLLQKVHNQSLPTTQIYFIHENNEGYINALKLADQLRHANFKVMVHCGGTTLKNQFKKADKSQALLACILGEKELQTQTITLKCLRADQPQETISQKDLLKYCQQFFIKNEE